MKKGRPALLNRSALLALVALLGLTVAVGAGGAVASSNGDVAVAAKKKCKKGKKSAVAAKKKKCKKKKTTPPATTATTRATLTWNDASDLNLVAWAPGGQFGSILSNPIPSTQFSANDTNGFGPETFTDLTTPNRQFSYGVCAGSGVSDSTVATVNYRRANGTTNTFSSTAGSSLDEPGDLYVIIVNPGGYDPSTNPCP
jgi:hypothetical protein